MKILVTGGCGFMGSHIARRLATDGHEVSVIDRDIRLAKSRIGDTVKDIFVGAVNCCNREDIIKEVCKIKPEAIIHLAAETVAKHCDLNPDYAIDSNIGGLANTLLAAYCSSVKRFVFVSSSFVYGDFQYVPADEMHPTRPRTIYGGTKLTGEAMVAPFCQRFGIEWVTVRPSAVYGEFDNNHRVVQVLLENALNGKRLKIEGADTKLDFTYIGDVVEGVLLALLKTNAVNQIFNITRGEGRSLRELSTIIAEQVGAVEIDYFNKNVDNPVRGTLDINKAKNILGYIPQWSLEDGIKKYLEWMRSQ